MGDLEAKECLSGILLRPDQPAYRVAALYMVYTTIKANDNITLNRLKRALYTELMMKEAVVEGAVASLASKSLFDAITKWQKPATASSPEVIHLRTTKNPSPEFDAWFKLALDRHPELLTFKPPLSA